MKYDDTRCAVVIAALILSGCSTAPDIKTNPEPAPAPAAVAAPAPNVVATPAAAPTAPLEMWKWNGEAFYIETEADGKKTLYYGPWSKLADCKKYVAGLTSLHRNSDRASYECSYLHSNPEWNR